MPLKFFSRADYVAMPWRNGLGTTTELAREDAGGAAGFLWRLSRADVAADGAFSAFAGVERVLVLLSGAGLRLAFDDREVVLARRHEMVRFAGDEPAICTLIDGPCEDLSVMVDRRLARAEVALCEGTFAGRATSRTLLHAREGDWDFWIDGARTALPADGLVLMTDEAGRAFEVRGRGALFRIDIEIV
jgi:environmental stress-induced protein Ves